MNIIIDSLPNCIDINGIKYKINTDFRVWIKIEILLQTMLISPQIIENICYLIFEDKNVIYEIHDWNKIFDDIILFYKLGKEPQINNNENVKNIKRLYDFNQDSVYIYSAFKQFYNIDLQNVEMHWWKFKTLFDGLPDEAKISQIIGYRATDASKIKNKAEKKRIIALQRIYKIKDELNPTQIEHNFEDNFVNMFV